VLSLATRDFLLICTCFNNSISYLLSGIMLLSYGRIG
jgi:hypothetical protein